MKHILMAGSFGQGNLGDDAILGSMVTRLRTLLPDVRLQAVAGDVSPLRDRYNVETVDWGDWAEIMSIVRETDLVISGGGGIFFDYHGFDPRSLLQPRAPDLSHYATFPLLAALYGKPFMLYGVGVGPLVSEEGRDVVKLAFEQANVATVRDEDSRKRLAEIGVDVERVEITADAAFDLQISSEERSREIFSASGCDLSRPTIAIAPKPWPDFYSTPDWHSTVAAGIRNLMEAEGVQVLLIAFQPSEDAAVISSLRRYLPGKAVHTLPNGLSPSEVAGVMGLCDLVVGVRLHALIFAMLNGVPGIALSCEPKVRAFMSQAGQPDLCIEPNDLTRLSSVLPDTWAERKRLAQEVIAKRSILQAHALRNAALAAELLNNQSAAIPASPRLLKTLSAILEWRLKEDRALGVTISRLVASQSASPHTSNTAA